MLRLASVLTSGPVPETYQRVQPVLQSLHGERDDPFDHMAGEIHVQREVQVPGEKVGNGGEGARVRHADW